MPRLIWSPAALDDLDAIDAYFLEHDVPASNVFRALDRVAHRLLDYPRLGRALSEPFRVMGVRGTDYILIYRLRDEGVEIVRIRHGREDWLGQVEAEL
ncbi:Plasmid stabilization system protein ParE [Sphingomonas sp. NFR15]|nr:Plasmid stabilization system protein ParE [Sphingomonas sp. NFR15]